MPGFSSEGRNQDSLLPVVSNQVALAVAAEAMRSADPTEYLEKGEQRLRDEQPALAFALNTLIDGVLGKSEDEIEPSRLARLAMGMMYSLLATQAEANALNAGSDFPNPQA